MKLEPKYIYPYLNYKLRFERGIILGVCEFSGKNLFNDLKYKNDNVYVKFDNGYDTWLSIDDIKLILRPLSDLTKEIEVNGERFVPIGYIIEYCCEYHSRHGKDRLFDNYANTQMVIEYIKPKSLSYSSFEMLLEWHFDVFGLIPENLAIDINTLNQNI